MTSAEIVEAAEGAIVDGELSLGEDIRAVIAAIEPLIRADERRIERDAVTEWMTAEVRIAYARRSYVAANTLHRAVRRLSAGMHRTGKVS